VSNTKISINDTISRNSGEYNSISQLSSIANEKININHMMPKQRHSDGHIMDVNEINLKKKQEKLKIININLKHSGSIKETLIHDKIDYKPSINLNNN